MATIIASIIVFCIVGLDVFYLIRQKKQGKSSCSCGGSCSGGCSGCSSNGKGSGSCPHCH